MYHEANPQFGIQDGDISWVRSLAGYRLGVILPKGYAFLSSNVAAQVSTLPDGRLELHFANPSGLSNPLTVHARKTSVEFTPTPFTDMFFDDVKTLYDLGDPQSHTMRVEQIYSDFRKGDKPALDLLSVRAAQRSHRHRPRYREAAPDVEGEGRHGRQARRADRRRPTERALEGHAARSTIRATRSRTACSPSIAR